MNLGAKQNSRRVSLHKRRLFLEPTIVHSDNLLSIDHDRAPTGSAEKYDNATANANKKNQQKGKERIGLKRFTIFEDFHPVKKRQRHSKSTLRKPLSPKQNNGLPSSNSILDTRSLAKSQLPGLNLSTTATTVLGEKREEEPTPSKVALMPFSGIIPKLLKSNSEPSESDGGLYFQSPDKAAKRPLKRNFSEQCINTLASVSPGPNSVVGTTETENDLLSAAEGQAILDLEGEEPCEPFPSITNRRKHSSTHGNYHKINLRKKRYARGKAGLKGAALKRFILRKKQRFRSKFL